MSRAFSAFLIALLLSLASLRVSAFALLGPLTSWQTAEIGYDYGGEIGGPMNINEGYRWAVPIMTYGYDSSFLKYFGTNGVNAIEAAVSMLNALPPADAMSADLSEFPLKAMRINDTASALRLIDLKTWTAGAFLEQLGLAAPERYVWGIRSRYAPNAPAASYSVIQRNWDPITRNQSSYVNGELFTFTILQTSFNPDWWEAVKISVDPLADGVTSLAGYYGFVGPRSQVNQYSIGAYYNSLTRDDAGGLRHLLETRNLAVEPLGTDVVAGAGSGGSVNVGGSSEAPWFPVTSIVVVTNGTGTGTTVSNGAPRVGIALRPGVGKITFTRLDYDSLLGSSRAPYQITWTDRYVTNGVLRGQVVSRTVTRPDIVFSAADLGVGPPTPGFFSRANASLYENNSSLNGTGNGPGGDPEDHYGPGVRRPPLGMTFSNAGRFYVVITGGGQGGSEDPNDPNTFSGISYGSFDGSGSTPIIYPDGLSAQALETLVLSGQ